MISCDTFFDNLLEALDEALMSFDYLEIISFLDN